MTEFLPVSSTAHLLVLERLLGFDDPGSAFAEMIQLGSIIALMWLYRQLIAGVVVGLASRPEARRFALMLFVAFVPAVLSGALLADYVEGVLHKSIGVMAVAFVAGGIVMLLVERYRRKPAVIAADRTPFGRAAGIGAFQALALVPGVSRSGATIVGGMLMGLDRPAAAEFSFFLAMPTMAAAFVHSFMQVSDHLTPDRAAEIAVGFVMAFLASAAVVKPFLNFVSRRGFGPFAWYRIVVGLVLLLAAARGWL